MNEDKFTGVNLMQGDTQWFEVTELPKEAKKIAKQFVAASERSGSFHALFGNYDLYAVDDGFFLEAKEDCIINHALESTLKLEGVSLDQPKVIPHKDHRHSIVPKGIYFTGLQGRLDPLNGINKKVED